MTRTLVKLHTWMALVALIPLLVICLTGSILVFKHEIDSLLMADKVRVEVPTEGQSSAQAARVSLDSLLAGVNRQVPNHEVVGWVLFQDPARADLVYVMAHGTSEWSYVLLNQYTGALLAQPQSTTHYLTDWLLELHYTLLLDHAGLVFGALVSIILCALGISGVIIYRKFWKNFFTLRWGKRRNVFYTDLHKMVGIISTPIFLIVGFTGAWWNIEHFYQEEIEHPDHEHHIMQSRLYNDELSLQQLHDRSREQVSGFTPTYFLMPYEPGINITFWGEVPSANPFASEYSSTVTFDAHTGEYLAATDIREAGLGAKFVDSFRELHFGTFAGIASRVLWCLVGLAPAVLSFTGVYVWYSRKRKRRQAKTRRGNVPKTALNPEQAQVRA